MIMILTQAIRLWYMLIIWYMIITGYMYHAFWLLYVIPGACLELTGSVWLITYHQFQEIRTRSGSRIRSTSDKRVADFWSCRFSLFSALFQWCNKLVYGSWTQVVFVKCFDSVFGTMGFIISWWILIYVVHESCESCFPSTTMHVLVVPGYRSLTPSKPWGEPSQGRYTFFLLSRSIADLVHMVSSKNRLTSI